MCRELSAVSMVLLVFSKVFPLPLLSAYYFFKGINSLVLWGRLLVLVLKGCGGTSIGGCCSKHHSGWSGASPGRGELHPHVMISASCNPLLVWVSVFPTQQCHLWGEVTVILIPTASSCKEPAHKLLLFSVAKHRFVKGLRYCKSVPARVLC